MAWAYELSYAVGAMPPQNLFRALAHHVAGIPLAGNDALRPLLAGGATAL